MTKIVKNDKTIDMELKVICPKKKWNGIKIKQIHFTNTIHLNKSHRNAFYKSLKLGYKYVNSNPQNEINKYIGAYYSLLNGAYENGRIIFSLSLKSLNKIITGDQNLQKKQAFSKADYRTFIHFIVSQGLMNIHNPNRSGKETLIVEIQDPDFIPFFIEGGVNNRDEQLQEVLLFHQNKNNDCVNFVEKNQNSAIIKKFSLEPRTNNLELRTKNLEPTTTINQIEKEAAVEGEKISKELEREMAIKMFLLDSLKNAEEMMERNKKILEEEDEYINSDYLDDNGLLSINQLVPSMEPPNTTSNIASIHTTEQHKQSETLLSNWDAELNKLKQLTGAHFDKIKNIEFLIKVLPALNLEKYPDYDRQFIVGRIDAFASKIYEPASKEPGTRIKDKVAELLNYIPALGNLFPMQLFLDVIDRAFQDSPVKVHKTVKELYKKEIQTQFKQNLLLYERNQRDKNNSRRST